MSLCARHQWVKMCRWRTHDQVFFKRCKKCGARKYGNDIFWRKVRVK